MKKQPHTYYTVAVWATPESRTPVAAYDYHGTNAEVDAEAHAARLREQITRNGWTHRVSVGPVFVQQ